MIRASMNHSGDVISTEQIWLNEPTFGISTEAVTTAP